VNAQRSAPAEVEAKAVQSPRTSPERVTVALIPRAADQLEWLQQQTQLSKTDIVNRSITLYAFIEEQMAAGNEIIIRDHDGSEKMVRFL
jgi:uncharacterized protein (DUF342 family)